MVLIPLPFNFFYRTLMIKNIYLPEQKVNDFFATPLNRLETVIT